METWFSLPYLKAQIALTPPPKWKMAIVVFISAYIITSISRSILTPFIGQWPIWTTSVVYTSILVVSLTFFAMPIMSRLFRRWLYP
jgi:antibiotic biosynthesis monooxygenase (ABM) superfamily enzyme